jgi:hypothetical protein
MNQLNITDEVLDCILNSFNAQKLRIRGNIIEAKKAGAMKEVSEWNKLQIKADKAAKEIRDQTGRDDVSRRGEDDE